MARSRNIKPGLFKNEILGVADPIYTIIFQGLWVLADKEGRLEDRPLRIKAEIIPYREGIDVDIILNWLACNRFIERYKVNENNYIQVINFRKHQNPHKKEADSTIPVPEIPGYIQEKPVQIQENPDQAGLIPDSRFLIPDSLIPEKDLLSDSSESGQTKKQFKKPSIEEITIYCQERKNRVDPDKFFNFYESKGWMIGKNKMKNWRSAIITWEKGEDEKPGYRKNESNSLFNNNNVPEYAEL